MKDHSNESFNSRRRQNRINSKHLLLAGIVFAAISFLIIPFSTSLYGQTSDPTITLEIDNENPVWGEPITATIDAQNLNNGTSHTIEVDWADDNITILSTSGSSFNGEVTHTFASPGSYLVEARVMDGATEVDSDTFLVTVGTRSTMLTVQVVDPDSEEDIDEVPWDGLVKFKGELTDASGAPAPNATNILSGKIITFSGNGAGGAPDATTNSPYESDGTAPGTVGDWIVEASFAGDSLWDMSNGTDNYSTIAHTTAVNLTGVPDELLWGEDLGLEVEVFDTTLSPPVSISGANVTFSGNGAVNLPAFAITNSPTPVPGNAPSPPEPTGAKSITGAFTGDSQYEGSIDTISYTTLPHATSLSEFMLTNQTTGDEIFEIDWFYAYNASGATLTDLSAGGPVSGKLITFNGSAIDGGGPAVASGVTDTSGIAPATKLIASQNIGSQKVQAVFAGDGDYLTSISPDPFITINKHDISLSPIVLPHSSREWYFNNTASTEATDIDRDGVDPLKLASTPLNPSGIPITFSGDAVDSPVTAPTGSPAVAAFVISQNTGPSKSVNALSAETGLYNGGATSNTSMEVRQHGIDLSLTDFDNEFWDLDVLFAGVATDVHALLVNGSKLASTPVHPGGLSISFTGNGTDSVAGPGTGGIALVLTMAPDGNYSAMGFAPYAPPASGWTAMSHSAETLLYLPDDSPEIMYDTKKHTTLLDLDFRDEIINVANAGHPGNPLDPSDDIISFVDAALTPATTDLRSVQEDRRFAVGGTLIDTAYPFTDIAAKPIRFEFDPGVSGLAAVTTTPVTFEGSNIAVDTCPVGASDCSRDALDPFGGDASPDSNTYLSLGVGDKINFPSGTLNAALYLQNNGDNNFSYLVHHEDGSTRAACLTTTDNDFLHVPIANINPIPDAEGSIPPVAFELTQDDQGGSCSDPVDTLNIAAMLLKADDARNPPTSTYALSFENEVTGAKSSPFEVHAGAFTSFGLAGEPAEDLMVRALFDEDRDYLASDKTGFIDILITTETSGTVGAGGSAVVVTEDTPDFTSFACSMPREIGGNDLDFDGVCDDIEIANLINVGGASLTLDPEGLNDVSLLTKDIYVEMDGTASQLFAQTTVDELEAIFDTAPLPPADFDGIQRPYKLHIVRDETITAHFPTKVWTDTSSSWLSGTTSISITDSGGGDKSRQFTVSGLSVRTTGAVTSHQLQFKFLADFSASPGTSSQPVVTTPSGATLASGKSAFISSISSSAVTVSGTGLASDKRLMTVTLTFTTVCVAAGNCALDTDAEGALGTTTFSITMPSTKTGVTLDSVTMTSGTPLIINNNDFDGIKKNYFGTQAERNLSGGTLGQRVANLVAKLSFYHYVEVVRTTGSSTTVCGSSGWAEDGGNDILISLGQRSGPIDCFTGVAGSVNEQKGTFLHELGHNLGLHHGGNDDLNCKINYPSVMTYARQIPVSGFGIWRADYSREVLASFDERTLANGGVGINENLGNGLRITPSLYPAGTTTIDLVYGNGAGVARVATIGSTAADINFDGDAVFDELLRPLDITRLSGITGCHLSGTNSVLSGFNDWANLNLPFVESGVLHDGVNGDVDGEGFEELTEEANQGIFSGLLSPIVQVALDDLPGDVKQYPSKGTAKLQFTYERLERDGGGLYPPDTILKARLFKITEGLTEPDPATTKVPVPLQGGDQFRFDNKNMAWVYNLDLSTLDPNFIYGVEVWRDAIGEGGVGPLDNNGDGFAGFFFVKK